MSFNLESKRLRIREWMPEDRAAFETLAFDPEVQRYMAGRPFRPEEVDAFFERQGKNLDNHGMCMGALESKETAEVIGVGGIQPLGTTDKLEIGYWLLPSQWGKGFATETGELCIDHAFGTLDQPSVCAITKPENWASRRVMERLAMSFVKECTGADLGHRHPELDLVLYEKDRS